MLNFVLLFLMAVPAESQVVARCNRSDTKPCGTEALYASKLFRESIREATGKNFDLAELKPRVRFHDAGWASYKLGQKEQDFAKRNNLPDSFFKKTQWYLIEISAESNLLKTFQVDLDFQKYDADDTASDYKIATVENARVTELPPYKLEEERHKVTASRLAENGFVCESESMGLIVRGEPVESTQSFGQVFDAAMARAKEGKSSLAMGSYRVVVSEFGNRKPPTLPPAVEKNEVALTLDLEYSKGDPVDRYNAVVVASSPAFSFWRALSGYNNHQKYCNSLAGKELGGEAEARRKDICETEPNEALEIKTHDKRWDKVQCRFYEKSAFARQ